MRVPVLRPWIYEDLLPYIEVHGKDPERRLFILHESVAGMSVVKRGVGFVEAPDELRQQGLARAGLGSIDAIGPEFYVPTDIECPETFCLHAAAKHVFDRAYAESVESPLAVLSVSGIIVE